jgi:hypothetical protein
MGICAAIMRVTCELHIRGDLVATSGNVDFRKMVMVGQKIAGIYDDR